MVGVGVSESVCVCVGECVCLGRCLPGSVGLYGRMVCVCVPGRVGWWVGGCVSECLSGRVCVCVGWCVCVGERQGDV